MTTPTIELGEVSGPDPVDPQRRRLPARTRRILLVAALASMSVFGMSASQRPEPRWTEPLWTAESRSGQAGFSLGSLNMYDRLGTTVLARDLRTGELRWWLDLDRPVLGTIDLGGGMAAVIGAAGPGDGVEPGGRTFTFVDDLTGQLLGNTTGRMIGVSGAGRVLLASAPGPAGCPDGMACTELSGYDTRTGARVWRALAPGHVIGEWARGQAALDRFAMASPDGSVALYDTNSGDVIGRVALPARQTLVAPYLTAVGDTVVEILRDQRPLRMIAYGLDPQRRLFSLTVPEPHPATPRLASGRLFLSDCGRVQCLHRDGYNVIIDVATGARRATVDAEVVGHVGNGLLLASSTLDSSFGAGVQLLDPDDGRAVASFPDSSLLPWVDSGGRALLTRRGPRFMAFTILDGQGRPRPLGSAEVGASDLCRARAEVMACTIAGREVRVWRLPG